jgi:opacity protein-like surface antigen
MIRWTHVAAGAALLLGTTFGAGADTLEAQQRNFVLGAGVGAVFPTGELSDAYETGLHLDVHVEFPTLGTLPIGMRAEGGFQRFSHDDESLRFLSGRLNAIIPFALAPDARPYLIAGGGIYNVSGDFPHGDHTHEEDAENLFGINVGVGVTYAIGGLNTFVEARFHNLFEDGESIRFIPLTLGLRF